MTAIIINSPKYGEMEALISTNKLQKVSEFKGTWHAHFSKYTDTFYVNGNLPRVNGYREKVKLHRWVTSAPDGMVCDHKNHDTLDNTDENLRLITQSENMQNRKGVKKSTSNGIRGVSWLKRVKKWQVQVKGRYIGYFDDVNEAELAANEARLKIMPYSR